MPNMKTILLCTLFLVAIVTAHTPGDDGDQNPNPALRFTCSHDDDNTPNYLVLPEKSNFLVPFSANFSRQSNKPRSIEVVIERLCGKFLPLTCKYSGASSLTFLGCFKNGTVDPFFVPGQEVYFASRVTLTASCSPSANSPVVLFPHAHIRQQCDTSLSVQETTVVNYEIYITTLNFAPVYTMFAQDIVFSITGFAHPFIGRDIAFAYVQVNDPNISDLFNIIATQPTITRQSGNTVDARVFQTWKSLQLNDSDPLQIWNNNQFIQFDFNEYNQIANLSAFLDTAAFIVRFPLTENAAPLDTCTKIQNTCTGAYQQYASLQDCVNFMNSIVNNRPVQPPTSGNSVQCRAFHEVLARSLPSVHCLHTGSTKISPFVTPCQDF